MPSLIFGLPDVSFHFLSPPLRFALRSREAATMEEAVAGKKVAQTEKQFSALIVLPPLLFSCRQHILDCF